MKECVDGDDMAEEEVEVDLMMKVEKEEDYHLKNLVERHQ